MPDRFGSLWSHALLFCSLTAAPLIILDFSLPLKIEKHVFLPFTSCTLSSNTSHFVPLATCLRCNSNSGLASTLIHDYDLSHRRTAALVIDALLLPLACLALLAAFLAAATRSRRALRLLSFSLHLAPSRDGPEGPDHSPSHSHSHTAALLTLLVHALLGVGALAVTVALKLRLRRVDASALQVLPVSCAALGRGVGALGALGALGSADAVMQLLPRLDGGMMRSASGWSWSTLATPSATEAAALTLLPLDRVVGVSLLTLLVYALLLTHVYWLQHEVGCTLPALSLEHVSPECLVFLARRKQGVAEEHLLRVMNTFARVRQEHLTATWREARFQLAHVLLLRSRRRRHRGFDAVNDSDDEENEEFQARRPHEGDGCCALFLCRSCWDRVAACVLQSGACEAMAAIWARVYCTCDMAYWMLEDDELTGAVVRRVRESTDLIE